MEQSEQPQVLLTKKQRRLLAKQEKFAERQRYTRTGSIKRWGIGVGVVIIAIVGIWWLASTAEAPGPVSGNLAAAGHSKGNPEAELTVVEFSDFQCPACAAYFPLVGRLADEFGDSVRFVYRHFPLTGIHSNAEPAARASEAAGKQDKFWEMHDLLFERQNDWANLRNPDETFAGYAELLELDAEQFSADYRDDAIAELVAADERAGTAARVSGTPTFFVNGEPIENPEGYDAFRALLVERVGEPVVETEETGTTTMEDVEL